MKNNGNFTIKPINIFLKLHGWKIAWIITALVIELAFLIYEWREKSLSGFSWAKPLPPQAVEYTCFFIAAIMLICHEEHIDDNTAGIIINSNFFHVDNGKLDYMTHVGRACGKIRNSNGKETDMLTMMQEG